jgi:hypothetical protein
MREPNELRQVTVRIGAHYQIYTRHTRKECGTQPLRHAPNHPQDPAVTLVPLELADSSYNALLGIVAHGAGVHQHDVRILGSIGAYVAIATEHAEHQFGIRHIHLAAVGLDVHAFQHEAIIARHGRTETPSEIRKPLSE